MLDKTGQIPLYIQLKDLIQKKIEDGTYPEDTAIPSERELCNMYGVSRITVRQAIHLATVDGLLVKRQGKGTYVASKKIVQALEQITLFDKTMTGLGLFPRKMCIRDRTWPLAGAGCKEKAALREQPLPWPTCPNFPGRFAQINLIYTRCRNTIPGLASVCSPSATTTWPLTKTYSIPEG